MANIVVIRITHQISQAHNLFTMVCLQQTMTMLIGHEHCVYSIHNVLIPPHNDIQVSFPSHYVLCCPQIGLKDHHFNHYCLDDVMAI